MLLFKCVRTYKYPPTKLIFQDWRFVRQKYFKFLTRRMGNILLKYLNSWGAKQLIFLLKLIQHLSFQMGVVAIPMFILPFTIMVPKGLILQIPFWSTNTMVGVSFLIITGSLSAVVQLFIYRYLRVMCLSKVKNKNTSGDWC